MTDSLGFRHYGRGSLKIIMPRVYARSPRKEWIINPSLVIFLVSIITILIVNRTLLDKNLYKIQRTTIVLPHIERTPEPTVPKQLSLIKVLKKAAEKSLESPKKTVMEKPVPEKIEEPKPMDKPIPQKKIEALKPLDNKIEAKVIDTIKPLAKAIPEKTILPKDMMAKPIVARDIPTRNMPVPNRIAPSISPKVNAVPSASPAPAPKAMATRSEFSAMPEIKRSVTASSSGERMSVPPPVNRVPSGNAAKPELTQWDSAKLPVKTGGGGSSGSLTSSFPAAIPKKTIAAPSAPPPIKYVAPSRGGETAEELVIIKSKALGSSERVKNLKELILKKAQNMSSTHSPYTYKVKGYTCTLVIQEGAGKNKIIIDFSPSDAPFDVVSELERILPR